MTHQALLEAVDADGLFRHWHAVVSSPGEATAVAARAERALDAERGAVERHFMAIDPCLAGIRSSAQAFAPAPPSEAPLQ